MYETRCQHDEVVKQTITRTSQNQKNKITFLCQTHNINGYHVICYLSIESIERLFEINIDRSC